MGSIIIRAPTLEEATAIAAEKLGVPADNLHHKILKKPATGLLKHLLDSDFVIEFSISDLTGHLNMRIDNALKSMENQDGQFIVDFIETGIFITVFPAGKSGNKVQEADILNKLEELKISGIDQAAVRAEIELPSGKPRKIAEIVADKSLESYLKLEVGDDEMSAFLTIFPPPKGGNPISMEMITQILERNKISCGLKLSELKKNYSQRQYFKPFLIAEGIRKIDGKDAYLEYLFNPEGKIHLSEDSKGRVDFKEMGLIQSVSEGQLLALKHPPTKGTEGCTVRGRKLPPVRGKDILLVQGENTLLDSDKIKLFAQKPGRVVLRKGVISVEPMFVVKNVDYSTGNLDFQGTVVIEGTINDGFKIVASGDILVKKNVGKCHLESLHGRIIVAGGILGQSGGLVKAEGQISARFIENSTVFSKSHITVESAIMHSRIYAGGELRVLGGRGLIVGGSVQAREGITAREIGSIGFTRTELFVGNDPDILQKITAIKDEINLEEEKLSKIDLAIRSLNKLKKSAELQSDEEYSDKMGRLETFHKRQEEIIRKLGCEILELKNSSSPLLNSKIRVQGIVHPGVKMEIAGEVLSVKVDYKFSSFYLDPIDHRIKLGTF
ncbi:MAG: FapA family protein [Candidatus Wallbacteria bacterium]|nr:FapA family protein [Candidatus Wallbacteria bacterium]